VTSGEAEAQSGERGLFSTDFISDGFGENEKKKQRN
jgi:hypothetical protein